MPRSLGGMGFGDAWGEVNAWGCEAVDAEDAVADNGASVAEDDWKCTA